MKTTSIFLLLILLGCSSHPVKSTRPERKPAGNFTIHLDDPIGGDATASTDSERVPVMEGAVRDTTLDGSWRYARFECLDGSFPVPSSKTVVGPVEFFADRKNWGQIDIFGNSLTITETEGKCTRTTDTQFTLINGIISFEVPKDWHQNCTGIPTQSITKKPVSFSFQIVKLPDGEIFLVSHMDGRRDLCTDMKPGRLYLRKPHTM